MNTTRRLAAAALLPVLGAVLGAVLAVLLALPGTAHAHAILIAGSPAPGATLPAGPVVVTLRFNSRIDLARSRLTLTAEGAAPRVLPLAPGGPPDVMASAAELVPGAYSLHWQVLAVDGHITRGEVPFTVRTP